MPLRRSAGRRRPEQVLEEDACPKCRSLFFAQAAHTELHVQLGQRSPLTLMAVNADVCDTWGGWLDQGGMAQP